MKSSQKQTRVSRLAAVLMFALSGLLASGCTSTGGTQDALGGSAGSSFGSSFGGSFGEPDEVDLSTRNTSGIEDGTGLVGKMLLVDPVLRPVSTLKALVGVTLKSTTGIVERTMIDQVRLPGLERTPVPELSDQPPMDLAEWEQELDRMTASKTSYGSIDFLIDGGEYYPRLEQAVQSATGSIDMQTYIFDNDDVAVGFADLLRQRSDEVEVKVLVDGLADLINTRHDSASMPADTALPASISDYLTYESKVEFRKQSNPWLTGDHSKMTIIDESTAFIGGMNIGREYRYDWHDLMMEVRGPIVHDLQRKFDKSWVRSGVTGDYGLLVESLNTRQPDTRTEGHPIRILTTSVHDSMLYRAQLEAIRRARDYIYIQNAYFSDDKILFELARARRRGVDVRVILPEVSDSGILNLSNQVTVNTLLKNGIRVYAYPGMTHVKAAVYDGWACLGSANFDKLSLQVNKELNLATSDPETVQTLLDRVFLPDFEKASEIVKPNPLETRHYLAEFFADELF